MSHRRLAESNPAPSSTNDPSSSSAACTTAPHRSRQNPDVTVTSDPRQLSPTFGSRRSESTASTIAPNRPFGIPSVEEEGEEVDLWEGASESAATERASRLARREAGKAAAAQEIVTRETKLVMEATEAEEDAMHSLVMDNEELAQQLSASQKELQTLGEAMRSLERRHAGASPLPERAGMPAGAPIRSSSSPLTTVNPRAFPCAPPSLIATTPATPPSLPYSLPSLTATPSARLRSSPSPSTFTVARAFDSKVNRTELELTFGTSLRAHDTLTVGGRAATATALLEYEEWCDEREFTEEDKLSGLTLLGLLSAKEGYMEVSNLIKALKSASRVNGTPPPDWSSVRADFQLLCASVESTDAAVDAAKGILQSATVHVMLYLKAKMLAFTQAHPHHLSESAIVLSLLKGMNPECKKLFTARHFARKFICGRDLLLAVIELEASGDLPALLTHATLPAPSRVVAAAISTGSVTAPVLSVCPKFDALPEKEKRWYKSAPMPGEDRSAFFDRMNMQWGDGNCHGCGASDHQRSSCPVQRAAFEKRQERREKAAQAAGAPTVESA